MLFQCSTLLAGGKAPGKSPHAALRVPHVMEAGERCILPPLLPRQRSVIPSAPALRGFGRERSAPAEQFGTEQGNLTLAQPQQSRWKTSHLQPQIVLQLKVRCCSKTGQESYPQHREAGAEKPAQAPKNRARGLNGLCSIHASVLRVPDSPCSGPGLWALLCPVETRTWPSCCSKGDAK